MPVFILIAAFFVTAVLGFSVAPVEIFLFHSSFSAYNYRPFVLFRELACERTKLREASRTGSSARD